MPLFMGCRYVGRYVKDLLLDGGIVPAGYIDINPDKQGRVINGLKVYAPEDIKKTGRIIVTVELKRHRGIIGSLEKLNLTYARDYIFLRIFCRRDNNMQDMLISIITVCLNAVETIETTISSVLEQTYKNTEYIVIDGGSTDGTLQVIDKYRNSISTLVSEKDGGFTMP